MVEDEPMWENYLATICVKSWAFDIVLTSDLKPMLNELHILVPTQG